ncbi:MAG: O-linked N-acetylglucosamine transferase, SPINDLY family protein [Planctomycetota bacterium]|jgi:predicted O-linked N-acetylglucosamine transferase (SPINDLY family)
MQTETTQGRLNTLILKEGNLHLPSPTGVLPKSLIEANEAATTGNVEEATRLLNEKVEQAVLEIIERDPCRTDIMLVLGMLFKQTRQISKAKNLFEKILQQEQHPLVYNELGYICQRMGQLSQAIQYQKKAVEADPHNAELLANLARMLIAAGKVRDGINLFRKALEIEPANAAMHSNFLFNLHFLPDLNPQILFEEHERWGGIHTPAALAKVSHSNDPDPDRRLRIGYISPDFCTHPVAYFFEPLLDGHNHKEVEVFGYGNVRIPGAVTERLKQNFDHYRNIRGLDDQKVVDMIQQDKIDILVELAGHTTDNRLLVMAHKPAPIQVTYLGSPDTTGMEAIDYRFSDTKANSPESQKFNTEELVYLPDGFLCYRPSDFAPPVTPLPALRNNFITFGSFNSNSEIHPHIIKLWARILRANNGSRILLKLGISTDSELNRYYFNQFERRGINSNRVAICGWKPMNEHLGLYGQVDIALDTYPCNGFTTTCEALWMGVPVISLVGECHASRIGLSILNTVGLDFLAASTPEKYVAQTIALAANYQSLAQLRSSMRQQMKDSALCDAKGFAQKVETAYRKMWHRWINPSETKT